MRTLLLASALAVAAGLHDCALTNGTWPPSAWPSSHTRLEYMYTPLTGPQWSRKPIFYDYPTLRYRADSFFLSGASNPLTTLFNFTSYWFNQSLYMITYADARSLQNTSCIILDLGITMMRPDWMTDQGGCMGDLWTTQKSAGYDQNYYRSVWTRINALPQDEGNFDWFSDFDTGSGRMMQAPGQDAADYVINEEVDLLPADFTNPNDTTFVIPAAILPTCIPVGSPRSMGEARKVLKAANVPPTVLRSMPEIALAYHVAQRDALNA